MKSDFINFIMSAKIEEEVNLEDFRIPYKQVKFYTNKIGDETEYTWIAHLESRSMPN